MSDPASSDPLSMLAHVLDEMRETTALLPVMDLARSTTRPWWRTIVFGFARSQAAVTAGLTVQYLGENIDRARDHWREAMSLTDELRRAHHDNDTVSLLVEDLQMAGWYDVLPQLQHDAIPRPIKETETHLSRVVAIIRDCDHIILTTRSRLALQRMREDPVD